MGNVITKVGVTNCHYLVESTNKKRLQKQPLSFMYVFIHIIFRIRSKVTKHSRSYSLFLLTESEVTRDALLSIESIEVRPLVPKGILSVP